MEAVYFNRHGGPEVLELGRLDEPHAAPGQIRVAVRAASINPRDNAVRRGGPLQPGATAFPMIPGVDFAGVVDEIGHQTLNVAVGDEVFGFAQGGSFADYTLSTAFAVKPAELSWEQAAALPIVSVTAWRDIELLDISADDTLLIHGAAGGVGSVAVQLAVARGATVIGTASPKNHEYLRELGATPVAYGEGLVKRVRAVAPQGIDAVYDVAGKGALEDSIILRGGTERILTISDFRAAEYGITRSFTTPTNIDQILSQMAQRTVRGAMRVEIAEQLPFSRVVEAMRLSETSHVPGKIVLHR